MSKSKGGKNGTTDNNNNINTELGISEQLEAFGKTLHDAFSKTLQDSIAASEERISAVLADKVGTLTKTVEEQGKKINSLVASSTENSNRSKANEQDIVTVSTDLREVIKKNEQLRKDINDLKEIVDVHSIRNKVTEQRLADLTDRSTRKTVVIRGVPEHDGYENDSDVTRDVVAEAVSKATRLPKEMLIKSVERIHRSGSPKNPKKKGVRDVHAVFFDWNDSQRVLKGFRINGKDSGIFVDQLYGKNTTYRRNLALKYRRELIDQGEIEQSFVAYPAKLLIKL